MVALSNTKFILNEFTTLLCTSPTTSASVICAYQLKADAKKNSSAIKHTTVNEKFEINLKN